MARLRGGVFGCGMISEFHLRGWQRLPEVNIVAIGNRTAARAEARRSEFFPAAAVYTDLAAMLETARLDFIDILTVPWLHREHCLLAREAGVHIICQKPLCDSLDDARALVAAMATYPKLFAVHENHPFRPWFQRVQALLRDGALGTPRYLEIEQYDSKEPPERYKRETRWGVLLEYGTHLVDMVIALLGPPDRTYARLQHLNPNVHGESQAVVVYEYPQTTAVVDIGWKPGGLGRGGFFLECERGSVQYEGTLTRGESARFRITQADHVLVDETRSPYQDYVDSFYGLERECVDSMLTGRAVTQSGSRNLQTLGATFASYEAARRGETLSLAPFLSAAEEA